MELKEYSKMYRLESDYWWFKGKQNLLHSWVDFYYKDSDNNKKSGLSFLDVGCGTGIIMKILERYGDVHGLDISDEALKFCRRRGLKNLKKGSVEKLPYPDNYFDVVTALDVISSRWVKDDNVALREIHRVLKKGGRLFLTDSAMKCLTSRHDKAHYVKERYHKEDIKNKFKRAGFDIDKISYFNTFLFLPVLISRKIDNIRGCGAKSDIKKINPVFNWILYRYYSFELSMMRFISYPFGVSIFVIGKKY